MYKCNYFGIKELVSPKVYKKRGEKAWSLFDDRALKMIDLLREHFGECTINNWYWGGEFKQSGFRTMWTKWWRMFSQHTFGRAFDLKFKHHDAFEIRRDLKDNWDTKWKFLFKEIGIISISLEEGSTITWVHIDIRNNAPGVNIFYVGKQ